MEHNKKERKKERKKATRCSMNICKIQWNTIKKENRKIKERKKERKKERNKGN